MDKSTTGRYYMILGRDLVTTLGPYLKFYDNIIVGGDRPYEGRLSPIVDASNYSFNYLTNKTFKMGKSFIKSYVDEGLESVNAIILK